MTDPYRQFLEGKVKVAPASGFDVAESELHPLLIPHQRDAVRWACLGGRRALFEAFGLGKSIQQLEVVRLCRKHAGGAGLIVCPLGVRQEFRRDAEKIDLQTRFIRTTAEVDPDFDGIHLTNYESIRDGKLDPNAFTAVSLDEAAVLRSFGSKTYQTFLQLFDQVRYRFVATATPSPNRYNELIHYAGFLGVMDTGQALTRWFQRDSSKAGNLQLYPHKSREFWLWVASWALFLQRPSDLCDCTCHAEKKSAANGSESYLSQSGCQERSGMEHGNAYATAADSALLHQTTCSRVESSAVVVSGRAMGKRERLPTSHGVQCSTGSTATERTTQTEELPCAKGGDHSSASLKTSEILPQDTRSTESTMIAGTNPETADGRHEKSKPETPEETSSSDTKAVSNQSLNGPKSTGSAIGSCIPDTSTGGPSNACSETCARCRELDKGYDLPELTVHRVEIPVDHTEAGFDRWGQGKMFRDAALDLQSAAREKRDSIPARVSAVQDIIAEHPDRHFLIWHDLEAERHAIAAAVPDAVSVYGSQDLDDREAAVIGFSEGRIRHLSGKPVLMGTGCNFQHHCHSAIFAGIGFKFHDFIQAIHRIQRFLQPKACEVWLIYTESEREVLATLEAKWRRHKEQTERMSEIIREYGLGHAAMAQLLERSIGVERVVAEGEGWSLANNDAVLEARQMATDSVGLIVTSIPFANHYEYSPSYNDFGHTDDNPHFWAQMDHLTPELLRVLSPGRIFACHVKDRINFGHVTGAGVPTVQPFHAEAISHYRQHGFDYMGMITIVTDVVRENNQTYRLGWSEQCKDGTKMGVGSPEYVLLFHKPQTDRTKGYADIPVRKDKADYTRARWQVDAHAFWRSSGDRLPTPDELAQLGPDKLAKLFTEWTLHNVYDFETHIRIGEALEARGALPSNFMAIAPGSHDENVWHNVNRMLTLNGEQSRRGLEQHICPLQFDIVDRLIERFSNAGDLVHDPFCGLGTVPLRAIKKGRKGSGSELSTSYWADSVKHLQAAERELSMPTLFDSLEQDKAA